MLDARDISPDDISFLMNALYFKAPWVPEGRDPLFKKEVTSNEKFYPNGSDVVKVPTMYTSRSMNYSDAGDFQVLEIPYANCKFAMYILLPDGDLASLMKDFPTLDWKGIVSKMKYRDVVLALPKFETSSSFQLKEALKKLGLQRAFTPQAQFDRMFQDPELEVYIDYVIQKARISVAEWGTEAAAVTVVAMTKESAMMPEDPPVYFTCDHPFAYLIAEKTSGTILFAGAYCGN
jgi:serpin B